jgi:DNA helicase HerA-like ATPase
MTLDIGEVVAVNGVRITLRVFEDSSKDTLYYEGEKYKGVSIREYITIQRGFREIVCIIEGEYLDEKKFEEQGNKTNFIRKIDAKPIGYIEYGEFFEGIKYLPMIKDRAKLLQEKKISEIYSKGYSGNFAIGKMLKEDIPVSLPWSRLFNTHIGIFGNTGSGKSNTLAKLYTVLFEQKLTDIGNKSKFVFLDFNGEYTNDQLAPAENKKIIKLNTGATEQDKFPLNSAEFWHTETLSILFQATTNTQRPFLNRLISGRERYLNNDDSLKSYISSVFRAIFSTASPKPETLQLARAISNLLNATPLTEALRQISWHTESRVFYGLNEWFNADGDAYDRVLNNLVDAVNLNTLDIFDELIIRANLQLTRELINGFVQFDHIQPLLKRMDSSLNSLRKVITVQNENVDRRLVTIVSLRKCNQEIKKVLPLLIAKHFYHEHKVTIDTNPNYTMHLIIDEAHNILSQQSSREHESWKDYRLELFEEIIKEGRKFRMFITLASQRPADISPTIVSQLHNFFIHRLVNERDLFLLDNTISTLDNLSRSLIPNLARGACVITGTSFDLPMVLQIDKLDRSKEPDSADVNLEELWRSPHIGDVTVTEDTLTEMPE